MEKITAVEKLIRLARQINKKSKAPHDYGTGHALYPAEISTIEAIHHHKNVNATELAAILGVTNGAITQMTGKLAEKGLVDTYKLPENNKEIFFRLTAVGKAANEEHMRRYEKMNQCLSEYMDELKPKQRKAIHGFLDRLIEGWPKD